VVKLVLVANPGREHVGRFLFESAQDLGYEAIIHDLTEAYSRPSLIERIRYRLLDRKPRFIKRYSASLVALCIAEKPDFVLTTGCAPILAVDILKLKELGIKIVNFSTDDPWNRSHRSTWFFESLKEYDVVFTPRRHCIKEFIDIGIPKVRYIAFGYHPIAHYVSPIEDVDSNFCCDVLFYGGADDDRATMFKKFIGSGLDVHLYGSYWHCYSEFKDFYKGMLEPEYIPVAVRHAKLTICIGRKSNRDWHAMRSYEAPAMGACLLVEDTEDHRSLYGDSPDMVSYFSSSEDIVIRSKELIADPEKRSRMRKNVSERVTGQFNTYKDRLESMVKMLSEK
jgi:spore maturation protein CgeB